MLGVSDSRACCTPGQHRSTQRKIPCGLPNEERLTGNITALTREYAHYVYRMIAGILTNSGWHVNHKRVERIWRDTWETRRKAEMAIFEYINGPITRDADTQYWAGKAPSLSNGKWPKRALGAALKRERSSICQQLYR